MGASTTQHLLPGPGAEAAAKVAKAVYPALKQRQATGADPDALVNAVAAAAEGYPFPTATSPSAV